MSIEVMKDALEALEWLTASNDLAQPEDIPKIVINLRTAIKAAEKREPVRETWCFDDPPKRGVYQVKRVGKSSENHGFSYWNGERWGNLCSRRVIAQEIRDMGRNTPSKYPMYWFKKAAHGIKE